MNANEAPEKLYISYIGYGCFDEGHAVRLNESQIEYTRTDAFIEKACELLTRMIWEVTYEDLEGNYVQHYDKMEFIEDFKKYMED